MPFKTVLNAVKANPLEDLVIKLNKPKLRPATKQTLAQEAAPDSCSVVNAGSGSTSTLRHLRTFHSDLRHSYACGRLTSARLESVDQFRSHVNSHSEALDS